MMEVESQEADGGPPSLSPRPDLDKDEDNGPLDLVKPTNNSHDEISQSSVPNLFSPAHFSVHENLAHCKDTLRMSVEDCRKEQSKSNNASDDSVRTNDSKEETKSLDEASDNSINERTNDSIEETKDFDEASNDSINERANDRQEESKELNEASNDSVNERSKDSAKETKDLDEALSKTDVKVNGLVEEVNDFEAESHKKTESNAGQDELEETVIVNDDVGSCGKTNELCEANVATETNEKNDKDDAVQDNNGSEDKPDAVGNNSEDYEKENSGSFSVTDQVEGVEKSNAAEDSDQNDNGEDDESDRKNNESSKSKLDKRSTAFDNSEFCAKECNTNENKHTRSNKNDKKLEGGTKGNIRKKEDGNGTMEYKVEDGVKENESMTVEDTKQEDEESMEIDENEHPEKEDTKLKENATKEDTSKVKSASDKVNEIRKGEDDGCDDTEDKVCVKKSVKDSSTLANSKKSSEVLDDKIGCFTTEISIEEKRKAAEIEIEKLISAATMQAIKKKLKNEENQEKMASRVSSSPYFINDIGSNSSGSASSVQSRSTAPQANATKSIIFDVRAGVNLPYMPSSTGASLLPPASGLRLLVPQISTASPGSSVMYVPSTAAFLTSAGVSSPMLFSTNASNIGTSSVFYPPVPSKTTGLKPGQYGPPYYLSNTSNVTAGMTKPLTGGQLPWPQVPEVPKSSQGMIEMLKWEADNRINVRPKYVKPNPKAELGSLAKWLFDLGSDLVKEYVYHDLVRIQSKRKDEGKLTEKERTDFAKLQEIDEELNSKIGHLKFKLGKSCNCGFKTESANVMLLHQEFAHQDSVFLSCPLCKFRSRQAHAFRFHMEIEHNMLGRVDSRPSFFECTLCPYETNYANRLDQHKVRCQKQFRQNYNLHPSCMTGPEVNLCLENVFYFVFTRQFLNTITGTKTAISLTSATPSLPVKSPLPRILSASQRAVVPKPILPNTSITTTVNSSSFYKTPISVVPSRPVQNQVLSKTFPIISSKIGSAPTATLTLPSTVTSQGISNQQGIPLPNGGFEVCEICGGYVKDRKALRIHFFYAHRIDMPFGVFERTQPPLYCATCFARFWTAQGLQKHIEIHKADIVGGNNNGPGTGVAGKCISCGHRVPNILMHMRMVHNRELRHYLAALMCIFCGNRFSSKVEVENHMGSHHGVVVKNSSLQGSQASAPKISLHSNQSNLSSQSLLVKQATAAAAAAVAALAKPKSQSISSSKPSSSSSSGSKMNKGSQCVLCNLNFSRNVDLTRHCMRVHHTCMKCGLVVVDKESLNRHTCLHSAAGMRTCQICKEDGFHPAYYIKHMRDKHLRRCSVRLTCLDEATVNSYKRPITVIDSEDEESYHEKPPIFDNLSEVRFRPGPASKRQKLEVREGKVNSANKPEKLVEKDKDSAENADKKESKTKTEVKGYKSKTEVNENQAKTEVKECKTEAEVNENQTKTAVKEYKTEPEVNENNMKTAVKECKTELEIKECRTKTEVKECKADIEIKESGSKSDSDVSEKTRNSDKEDSYESDSKEKKRKRNLDNENDAPYKKKLRSESRTGDVIELD